MRRYQQHYHALGSSVLLTVVSEKNQTDINYLLGRLHAHIIEFEQQFSRFLSTSELTYFNQAAGQKTSISPELHKLLSYARDLAVKTNGLYNPFILPALQKAGYKGSWPRPDAFQSATDFTSRKVVHISQLTISKSWAKIPTNSALDFGGIGKGYLLDELAEMVNSEKLHGYWFSLGGDIICGGQDLDDQNWHVAVGGAVEASKIVATITNSNGKRLAIATSGITKRRGMKNGKEWHHLIDPRTGHSAQTNVLTTTVSADRAVIADVYAKCIVIGGIKQAKQYEVNGVIQSYVIQMRDSTSIIEGLKRQKA